MTDKIDKIFYINLDKRPDRRDLFTSDIAKVKLQPERFVGIPHNEGIVGCGKSHLAIMKMAKEQNLRNVLILEDDFTFLVERDELDRKLNTFFEDFQENYDVCMFCCQNLVEDGSRPKSYVSKIQRANNASAYLINGKYLDTIIQLYEHALPLLEQTGEHWNYANDQVWTQLQEKDNWYVFQPRLGKQHSGYSDNAKRFIDYDN
jgi:glycosyl transferase family 25